MVFKRLASYHRFCFRGSEENPFINGKKDAYLELQEKFALEKLQKKMNDMTKKMYALAQPVVHIIIIAKID
ncbi:MAG: hypothetical protein M3015_14415 [Bacteroidota bacterium]|nr:hypothetical protein [Bacteroidota bacterium]